MVYTLVFRIRKIYFDQIMAGTKTREVRASKRFWYIRALKANHDLLEGKEVRAVFLCGKLRHTRRLERVRCFETAKEALGREPSEQGKKDIGEGPVYGFDLGRVME